jgi:hypothetical protein
MSSFHLFIFSSWLDGWMVGWLDGWMVGWLDGWMVGCMAANAKKTAETFDPIWQFGYGGSAA